MTNKEKVLIITGPTASGKSNLAVDVARRLNGECISADAIAIYQKLDIGTAKISKNEQKDIPHHLIDILPPAKESTVVFFQTEARKLTKDILSRGRVPIIVGGTGYYLRSFIYNDHGGSAPSIPKELSQKIKKEVESAGWTNSVHRLSQVDPVYASQINANDMYRLVRALSVCELTGKPYSSFKAPDSRNQPFDRLDYDFRSFVVTNSRLATLDAIDYRCEEMVKNGLLFEVAQLLKKGDLRKDSSAGRSIGYRESIDFLLAGDYTFDAFMQFLTIFQNSSRQFAHRQYTYFRGEPLHKWISRDDQTADKIVDYYNMPYEEFHQAFDESEQQHLKTPGQSELHELRTRKPTFKIFSPHFTRAFLQDMNNELKNYPFYTGMNK